MTQDRTLPGTTVGKAMITLQVSFNLWQNCLASVKIKVTFFSKKQRRIQNSVTTILL